MNPEKIGKTLGIGLRVAGRIAQQRVHESTQAAPSDPANSQVSGTPHIGAQTNQTPTAKTGSASNTPRFMPPVRSVAKAHNMSRAAGRGLGGFLRPFGRLGGILWLEVTGFFFGLFALYFAQDIWRTRLSYAAGPQHQRFLIAVGLTLVFGYLSVSAFWRARRR